MGSFASFLIQRGLLGKQQPQLQQQQLQQQQEQGQMMAMV
jgi:hypothetical protein